MRNKIAEEKNKLLKNALEANRELSRMVLELRSEVEKLNEEWCSDPQMKEKIDWIPDLRTRAQLKSFLRQGFKGYSIADVKKTVNTYQLNYALTGEEFLKVTNEIEKELANEETQEFLEARGMWIQATRNEEGTTI